MDKKTGCKNEVTGQWHFKPEKTIVYDKVLQEKLYNEIKRVVIGIIETYNESIKSGRIVKANVFGSILHRKMGLYKERYENKRYGSDVDLICVAEPGFKAPKEWKINEERKHSIEYQVDSAENYIKEIKKKKDAPIHPINFLIFIPGKYDYESAKKWTGIDEVDSKKRGFLVETWFLDKDNFNKMKL